MQYMGGKARIAKRIVEVMLASTDRREIYIEPILGGCHILPLMAPHFAFSLASDAMPDVAMLWRDALAGWRPPTEVSPEEYAELRYAEPSALRGFVGFGCSFGGKWFGGYAKNGRGCDYAGAAVRGLDRKISELDRSRIAVLEMDYREYSPDDRAAVYCDPPYADTTPYKGAPAWDAEEFWVVASKWAEAGADVFVSEYAAPSDWVSIWTRTAAVGSLKRNSNSDLVTEHLFRHRSQVRT